MAIFALLQIRTVDRSEELPTTKYNYQEDILLFIEAVAVMQEKALFLNSDTTRHHIVDSVLKSYLSRNDPYSEFLSRDEYQRIKSLNDSDYVGIGMEIKKNREGHVVCFPYPGGPADKSGIENGDRLDRIEGIAVNDKSIFNVAAIAKGEQGTSITLDITTRNGLAKQISVTRAHVSYDSISTQYHGKLPAVEINAFTRYTALRLRRVLTELNTNHPVIIDLRGNSGGDLHGALDAAMLFLPEGKVVATIIERDGTILFESKSDAPQLPNPVYLWQDDATASAAEVFIAALTDNGQGISIGKRTFGKGTKQDIISLSDGSALILTTGRLLTPLGKEINDIGLEPMYPIIDDSPKTHHYLSKVNALEKKRQGQGHLLDIHIYSDFKLLSLNGGAM